MRYPLFCPSIFNGFFEEFIFHRFLAEQALEFFNLLHGGSKFRGRNNLFSGGDSSKTSFLVLLTGNDSNLLIVFYVQIMPDDFVMQLHRF